MGKEEIKSASWLYHLIKVYNELGGSAPYKDVYPLAKKIREESGASWTPSSEGVIRRTVEENAKSSAVFKGRSVFHSVHGHGEGVWELLPEYLTVKVERKSQQPAYTEGVEGIVKEQHYLRKSRDARLVEQRKIKDNYTCQVCAFRMMVENEKYIIDVHHLNPIGNIVSVVLTSINDLVCLCPTCHRIAHSRKDTPLSIEEIKKHR